MNSFYKKIVVFLIFSMALLFCGASLSVEMKEGGFDLGSGAGQIGNIPIDLVYEAPVPPKLGPKIDIYEKYSEAIKEYENYRLLFKQRFSAFDLNLDHRLLSRSLSSFDFHEVENLSCDDPMPVSGREGKSVNSLCTYLLPEYNEMGELEIRRIVEVDVQKFAEISDRYKALMFFHEQLHHENGWNHLLIAGFTRGLETIRELAEYQKRVFKRRGHKDLVFENAIPLFQSELKDLRFFNVVVRFLVETKMKRGLFDPMPLDFIWSVDPRGGGLYLAKSKLFDEKICDPNFREKGNFVGVLSTINFVKGRGYGDQSRQYHLFLSESFKRNEFYRSAVNFILTRHVEENQIFDINFLKSRFQNNTVDITPYLFSHTVKIKGQKNIVRDSRFLNQNGKFWIELSGNKNEIYPMQLKKELAGKVSSHGVGALTRVAIRAKGDLNFNVKANVIPELLRTKSEDYRQSRKEF